MKFTDDEAHRHLWQAAQDYVDEDGRTRLGGVNPPGAEEAAAGTWQGDAPVSADVEVPEMKAQGLDPQRLDRGSPNDSERAAPPPAPALAPKRKVDLNLPLGYRPPTPAPSVAKDTELADLQADAKKRRGMAELGQSVSDFAERPDHLLNYAQRLGGGGVSAPMAKDQTWKNHAAEGERAIEDLEQRRASDAKLGAAQTAAAAAAEENDPNSETANTYRSVLLKFAPNLEGQLKTATPKQMKQIAPWLEKYGVENAAALKAGAASEEAKRKQALHDKERAENEARHNTERGEDLINRKLNHADSQAIAESNNNIARASLGLRQGADARDAAKDAAAAAEKAKGHQTSTSSLEGLADAQTAIDELGPLGEKFTKLGMSGAGAKLSGALTDALDLQWTDAAEFKAAAQRAMQGVGKIMEGGKLAAGDEVKYRQMLPRAGDPPELAQQKIVESQAFLRKLKDERIRVLRAAGYNVPDVGGASAEGVIVTHPNGKRYRQLPDGSGEEVP